MKIGRFKDNAGELRVGMMAEENVVVDLTLAGITSLEPLLEGDESLARLEALAREPLPRLALAEVQLCAPVERQEIWAAGVTYLRSKAARMEESEFSATAYDKVYTAERPELFFKSLPEKVVGPGEPVGIRLDARWSVPEPELALVLNSKGKLAGYTLGNDMSSRDIEGENLLYLPQAKIYQRSCALGPWLNVSATEFEARSWSISVEIQRGGRQVFAGDTSAGRIKRTFEELAAYLFRSQVFPHGAILLTGTGIVPPDDFTLEAGDTVRIESREIGVLENPVMIV